MGKTVFVPDRPRQDTAYEAPLYEEHRISQFDDPLYWAILCALCLAATGIASFFGWKAAVGSMLLCALGLWASAIDDRRKCLATVLKITNREIRLTEGRHNTVLTIIRVEDVRDVSLTQTVDQKRRRLGTVRISSSGQAGAEIEAIDIPAPDRIVHLLSELRSTKS